MVIAESRGQMVNVFQENHLYEDILEWTWNMNLQKCWIKFTFDSNVLPMIKKVKPDGEGGSKEKYFLPKKRSSYVN